MMNLVSVGADNTPTTTTLIIAEGTGVQHKNVLSLVRQNIDALKEFGLVAFQTRARPEGQHGGGNTEYAVLNEQQATLLFTFMKNTKIVKAFKIALVKAFYEMAKKLREQQPASPALPNFMDPAAAAIAWAEQYRKAQALEAKAKEDAPKLEYANTVDGRGKGIIIDLVAKKLNVKPQWLRQFLRTEARWLRHDGAPMQWAVNQEYVTYKDWIIPHNSGIQEIKTTTYITGKGEIRLAQLISEYREKQATGGLFEEQAA